MKLRNLIICLASFPRRSLTSILGQYQVLILVCKSVPQSLSPHNYTMPYSAAGARTQGVILGSSVSLNATSLPTATSQVNVTSRTLYLTWTRNGLECEFCLLPPYPSFLRHRIKIQNVSEVENGKNMAYYMAYFSLELCRCSVNADELVKEEGAKGTTSSTPQPRLLGVLTC